LDTELKKKQKNKYKKYTTTLWLFFILGVSSFYGIFYFASIGGLGEMPDLKVLENPNTNLASEILSEDQKNYC
jgi:penicillin-binding protein 1A